MRKARQASGVLLLSVTVPILSAVPVLSLPAHAPRPVAPQVRAVSLAGVDPAALGAQGPASRSASVAARADLADATERGAAPQRPAVLTPAREAAQFDLLGVTWRAGSTADLTVLVRAHGQDGWSDWTALEVADTPPPSEGEARAGTEPLYVGPSDGYQVRVDVRAGRLPAGLRVDLVDPGESPADAAPDGGRPAATAQAAASRPTIYTRAQWGADERLRGGSPTYSRTLKAGFVHHTAGTNGYAASEVPKIIRGIYAYHTKSNGWSDIGYNFLVDRFGRTWEGRYGGISRPVAGAHAGGFNVDTFGVSAIGNFETAAAPDAMVDAIARLMAWKLSAYYRNPLGKVTLTSTGGGTSRYAAGQRASVHVIAGHRDTGYTACPGRHLYAEMATIRARAASYMGAGLVSPHLSRTSSPYGGTPVAVQAGALRPQTWTLEVREHCTGQVVRRVNGTASTSAPVNAVWNLRRTDGTSARPGIYDLALTAKDATSTAKPWRGAFSVTVTTPTPTVQPRQALPGPMTFVPLAPRRIYDSREGTRQPLRAGGRLDLRVLGVGGVPSTGVGAVALNVTAACPSQTTYVTAWPAGASRPAAPALRVPGWGSRTALAVSAVGGDGRVSLRNAAGTVDTRVDVVGYYPTTTTGLLFHPATPTRIYDSRSGSPLGDGESRRLTVPTLDGVLGSSMGAAVLNVTTVAAQGSGYLSVNPGTATPATTSTLSHPSSAPVKNRATAKLSAGTFRVANTGGAAHLVVDVVGYYAAPSTAGGKLFRSVATSRVLDTRSGLGARKAKVAGGTTLNVPVTGTGKPVPAGASAVLMSVTVTQGTARTNVTAWPTGVTRPWITDVVVEAGAVGENLVLVPIGSGGRVSLYSSAGSAHLLADVVGYYR